MYFAPTACPRPPVTEYIASYASGGTRAVLRVGTTADEAEAMVEAVAGELNRAPGF